MRRLGPKLFSILEAANPCLPGLNGSAACRVVERPVADIQLPSLEALAVPVREVPSEQADETYVVDLIRYTCSCPRFKQSRAHFPEKDFRRCCRHIARVLLFEKRTGKLRDFLRVMLVHRLNYGRGIWGDAVRNPLRYLQIEGEEVLLITGDSGAVDVVAPIDASTPSSGFFSYSLVKLRWSELGIPKYHLVITHFINQWAEVGSSRVETSPAFGESARRA